MYNANRDASESERKSLSQLHEALRVWEESEERRKKVNKNDVDVVAHQASTPCLTISSTHC